MLEIRWYPVYVHTTLPTEVEMPAGARILSVVYKLDDFRVYALVDPNAPTETRRVYGVGTGWDVPQAFLLKEFLGTVSVGNFVWHFFSDASR